jgi:hypothetical protein
MEGGMDGDTVDFVNALALRLMRSSTLPSTTSRTIAGLAPTYHITSKPSDTLSTTFAGSSAAIPHNIRNEETFLDHLEKMKGAFSPG